MTGLRVEGVLYCPACRRYFDLDCTAAAVAEYAAAHALSHRDTKTAKDQTT